MSLLKGTGMQIGFSDNQINREMDQFAYSHDETIKDLMKVIEDRGIGSCKWSFEKVLPDEFLIRKKEFVNTYLFGSRAIKFQLSLLQNDNLCIGLFDNELCLMDIFGNARVVNLLKKRGVEEKTLWDIDHLGINAVSVSEYANEPVYFDGENQYCSLLNGISMFCKPFSYITNYSGVTIKTSFSSSYKGLIAVFSFGRISEDYALYIINNVLREIESHAYFSVLTSMNVAANSMPVMVVDRNSKGRYYVIEYNEKLKNIFRIIRPKNNYIRLDTIIDPLPKNEKFWELLDGGFTGSTNLDISINGHISNYLMECSHSSSHVLNLDTFQLAFSSSRQIAREISTYLGNAKMSFSDIIGVSPAITRSIRQAYIASQTDLNVLLLGESGTGKDVFAQAIHNASSRSDKPFIVINCAALPRELIASELFGYSSGAFTGAKKGGNIGKIEFADSGTLFLDEIGDLPLDLQSMLLRILENKSFSRIGSNEEIQVDVRFIAATNANLIEKVEKGLFREDLYYRLNRIQILLPALKDRKEDIPLLMEYFLSQAAERFNAAVPSLSEETKKYLLNEVSWKGNIRFLQSMAENLVLYYQGQVITPQHVRSFIISMRGYQNDMRMNSEEAMAVTEDNTASSITVLSDKRGVNLSKTMIERELAANHFSKTKTAQSLGISRRTLYRWMDRLGIDQ